MLSRVLVGVTVFAVYVALIEMWLRLIEAVTSIIDVSDLVIICVLIFMGVLATLLAARGIGLLLSQRGE